jgi:hypothetical protein
MRSHQILHGEMHRSRAAEVTTSHRSPGLGDTRSPVSKRFPTYFAIARLECRSLARHAYRREKSPSSLGPGNRFCEKIARAAGKNNSGERKNAGECDGLGVNRDTTRLCPVRRRRRARTDVFAALPPRAPPSRRRGSGSWQICRLSAKHMPTKASPFQHFICEEGIVP